MIPLSISSFLGTLALVKIKFFYGFKIYYIREGSSIRLEEEKCF